MEVIKCKKCQAPLLSSHASCPSCGAASGAITPRPDTNTRELRKSALYLAAWWVLILGLSRFSLSAGGLALLSLVTGFYVVRLIRLWR